MDMPKTIGKMSDRLLELTNDIRDGFRHEEIEFDEANKILAEIKQLITDLGNNTPKETISLLMAFLTHPKYINMKLENFTEIYTLVEAIEQKQGRLVPWFESTKLNEA